MNYRYREPVYPIGVVARLLNVSPATLRIWEKKGVIKPQRLGKNRFYSQCDVDNLEYVRELLNKGVNIEGVKLLLKSRRCWDIKNCDEHERKNCNFYLQSLKG